MAEITPGWKTSEFWVTMLGSLSVYVQSEQGKIPEPWGVVAVTVIAGAYTISRAMLKARVIEVGPPEA